MVFILTYIFFLDSSYYYSSNDIPVHNNIAHVGGIDSNVATEQNSRSPLAATRANSLASANSPTESGSACVTKTENIFTHDLNLA